MADSIHPPFDPTSRKHVPVRHRAGLVGARAANRPGTARSNASRWTGRRIGCCARHISPFCSSRPSNLHKLGIWFPRNHKENQSSSGCP